MPYKKPPIKNQFKPGQTGNANGRPPGKTLKEYQAERFRTMTDEEREKYLKDIPKEIRWRMAEGNPKQDSDITSGGEKIMILPAELINKNDTPPDPISSSEGQPPVQSS